MAKHVYYGICKTAAGTTPKEVILQGEQSIPTIVKGDLLTVHFQNGNTVATPTIVLTLSPISTNTSGDTGLSIKMRGAEPSSGAVNEWDCAKAWEAGEDKQFVAELLNDNGDANSTQVSYWGMLDGGNATDELYGDIKLFNETNPSWLHNDPTSDEEVTAVTPATIRALFGGDDKVQLDWNENTFTSSTFFNLGNMTISTDEDNPQTIRIPVDDLKTALGLNNQPWLERTAQLKNNGHLDTNNAPVEVTGYGWRGTNRWFIENYETGEVEFTNNFTASGNIILANGGSKTLTVGGNTTISGPTTISNTLSAGATTVSSLTSSGTISADGAISSGSTITAESAMSEYNETLKTRYSGKLKYVKLSANTTAPIAKNGHTHAQEISIPANQLTGYRFLGIVGYNLNEINNNNKTHNCYVWECYPDYSNNCVKVGIRNVGDAIPDGINIEVWVLLERNL